MIIELSLMVASGAVIAFLYVHRYFGITAKVHTMRAKTDPLIEHAKERTNKALSHITWYHASLFIHNLFVYAARFFMHLSRKAHDSSARFAEKVSRRKEDLSKGRVASFYLKQIQSAKDAGEKPEAGGEGKNM